MAGAALALTVGTTTRYGFALPPGVARKGRVAAIDYGIKRNILRMLAARGLEPTVFPAATTAEELLAGGFDGYFLSNGPGDPDALPSCVAEVKRLVESGKPVFGICLGQQLLGLALGGTTYKLKFGHRGANHPVKNLQTGRVAITSQNHGFAVAADSLPPNVELTHVNLNDGTCEGFRIDGPPRLRGAVPPGIRPGPARLGRALRRVREPRGARRSTLKCSQPGGPDEITSSCAPRGVRPRSRRRGPGAASRRRRRQGGRQAHGQRQDDEA